MIVEHKYLWRVMESFGFNAELIAMIKVLYQNIESVLKFNGGLCAPFKAQRGVRQGCGCSGMLYAISLEPLLCRIRRHIRGFPLPGFDTPVVLAAYADDVIVMTRDQKDIDTLKTITDDFNTVSAAKVNWEKSEALAMGGWGGGLPRLPQQLAWKRDGLKYLGIYMGSDQVKKKNWENVEEQLEGRLAKWKWLLPQLSYRGRVLILNNLVASGLWHRLACVDPPPGLLANIQAKMVDFFWDRLHWVPQSLLFLPREEGGQGLVHLASRAATFRLQFVKQYLAGPPELVWRDVASCVLALVNGLGQEKTLFLMNPRLLKLTILPPFYQGLFKSWALFKTCVSPKTSLHWLLKEPLVCGARLDIQSSATPGLAATLTRRGTLELRQLVEAAGPALDNVDAVRGLLGVRSSRHVAGMLNLWTQRLTVTECCLMREYCSGSLVPDQGDAFPDIAMVPELENYTGPLLGSNQKSQTLQNAHRKALYMGCVQAIHRHKLGSRTDTVWRERLRVAGAVRPGWAALYKPPQKKRTADLAWRILHGAIAVNTFVHVLDPVSSNLCIFCGEIETLFHAFTECGRLDTIFNLLTQIFACFREYFSVVTYISGPATKKQTKLNGSCSTLWWGRQSWPYTSAGSTRWRASQTRKQLDCWGATSGRESGWTLTSTKPWVTWRLSETSGRMKASSAL